MVRRSAREFSADELVVSTIGQLFWAGQGVTDTAGHRTSPSAGATYPLELYAITEAALMHYLPTGHRVEMRADTRTMSLIADVAFEQGFVGDAAAVLVITGVRARIEAEYGAIAGDLMNRESGHVAQNILLQAEALGLAAVPIDGFEPAEVARLLALPPGEEALYLLPVGHPALVDAETPFLNDCGTGDLGTERASTTSRARWGQVVEKPISGQLSCCLEGAGFVEQVRCPRYDSELTFAAKSGSGVFVET